MKIRVGFGFDVHQLVTGRELWLGGIKDVYKRQALTRTNQAITEGAIKEFIETLNVSEDIKKELRVITPHNYTGI